jgi:hypothetical protein
MANGAGDGEGRGVVEVEAGGRVGSDRRSPDVADRAASVICRDSGFEPVEIKLVRGQGVVWFVTERRRRPSPKRSG